jgi:hypothetical protein
MLGSLLRDDGEFITEGAFVGLGERMSHRMAPTCDWTDMGPDAHFVQFFESDSFIVNEVSEYVLHGLKTGETCVVVATKSHLDAIEIAISKFAEDLKGEFKGHRYIAFDADETLSKIMTDGRLDGRKFSDVVGSIFAEAAKNDQGLRVFGEMVGILCSKGEYGAAIELEGLWNKLKKVHKFSLFCGYSMFDLTDTAGTKAMSAICSSHTHVMPAESYSSITGTKERLKHIAQLQQRNKELEAELSELEKRISAKQVGAALDLSALVPSVS